MKQQHFVCIQAVAVIALIALVRMSEANVVGLHFDIEPHQLPEWRAGGASQASIAQQFVDVTRKLHAETKGTPICLTMDVGIPHQDTPPGRSRAVFKDILDQCDRLTVMDYRDLATGGTRGNIIGIGQQFIDYGAKKGKKVVIGVETIKVNPPYITFYEEGGQKMETELTKTANAFKSKSSFDNFAIHELKSYMTLKNPAPKSKYPRDVWLWNYRDYIANPSTLFSFCKKNNIRTIYLEAQTLVHESSQHPTLRKFINQAGKQGICIELLFGYHKWTYANEHHKAVALARKAVAFLKTLGSKYQSGTPTCACAASTGSSASGSTGGGAARGGTGASRGNSGKPAGSCVRQNKCMFVNSCNYDVKASFTCQWNEKGTMKRNRVVDVIPAGTRDVTNGCRKCAAATFTIAGRTELETDLEEVDDSEFPEVDMDEESEEDVSDVDADDEDENVDNDDEAEDADNDDEDDHDLDLDFE